MQISKQPLAIAMLGSAVLALPAVCMACSLVAPDSLLLKKAMAKEIAFRLAIEVEQVPLSDITPPELQRPLALGSDCSGLAAFHHSSGFRIAVATQQHAFATMGKPHSAAGTGARHRNRVASGFYSGSYWGRVQRNFWRVPKRQPMPEVDYSGYVRWPQYPDAPHSGAQDTQQFPVRWSTLNVTPGPLSSQAMCRYEGMAVVLGYDSSSPVAVNFTQRCDGR